MGWFEGIEKGSKLKITLENNKEFIFIFEKESDGIIHGTLENGKIKKFKESKIDDLEEIYENESIPQTLDLIPKNTNTVSNNFIYKIENFVLHPIEFKGKEEFEKIKKENKELYDTLISLYNKYQYAKKINEIDLKYNRSNTILYRLKELLEQYNSYEEIDKFLAFLLQEIDITFLEFFKQKPVEFYCFKNDIFYYYKRNSKKGFILTEDFFDEFFLDEFSENEWLYGVKNIINFNSIKILISQYEEWDELDAKYKIMLEESVNYIVNKTGLNINGGVKEKLTLLQEYFTTNSDYKTIKKEIENIQKPDSPKIKETVIKKTSFIPSAVEEKYGNYRIAKTAKDKKEYLKAIKYYKLAYKYKEKLESTIKDLAVTYYEIGNIEESKNFIFENEKKLSNTISTYNFLENLYYSLGEYQKTIHYIDLLLKHNINNTNKYTMLLAKKASCYIKLNKITIAKGILKQILSLNPGNSYAKKLLEEIESGGEIKDIDITYFGGGISKYIEETLNQYEEYSGIPPKIKESKNFDNVTLKEIRKLIETAGKARPKERANYLLTEAKLMQELEPNKEEMLRSVLARYCNAMALTHISENSQKEVIKFFYLEAFSLEDKWDSIIRQLYVFIEGLYKKYNIKTNMTLEEIKSELEKSILNALNNNFNIFLENILDIFIVNNTIAKEIINIFFTNKKIYNIFQKKMNINFKEKTDFVEYWNKLIEKRKREYKDWLVKINSITKIDNIENLNLQIQNILNDLHQKWLSHLDEHRLYQTIDISSNLNNFLKQRTFDDKERTKNYLITQLNDLITDIKEYPTKLSYEGYLPILKHIEKLIQHSFNEILKSSTPEISLEVLGDCVVDKNSMGIKLNIQNSPNSSPVSNIIISVEENTHITYPKKNKEIFELLRGGNNINSSINLTISDEVIKNKAIDIKFIVHYKIVATEEIVTKEFKLPIRLYTSDEFEKIENVYAPIAEGGAVKDEKMFFGRREYIDNIINSLITKNAKSIIIYGQKRSGKSTVLYHLQKALEKKENAFCIDFTTGEIIDEISDNFKVVFYYKILSSIEEKLEELEFEGVETIPFEKPSLEELMKAPSIVFDESIKKFYKSFKQNEFWKNKKLIILIDEFTYIYTSIIKNQLSDNFMKTWKAFIEKNIFSAVLVGQDITPKFKAKFPNEFGVTEDKRLTYLSKEDAKKLIEQPIWNKKENKSRYLGNAVEKIIDYTACNPYYLQMFCSRVVDYMNNHKAISVTEGDVEEVFKSFIEGSESLTEDKFDNLLTAGDADINSFNIVDVKNILRQIAKETMLTGSCFKEKINFENTELLNKILDDLIQREVISQKENTYKIKVELFEQWLLKH